MSVAPLVRPCRAAPCTGSRRNGTVTTRVLSDDARTTSKKHNEPRDAPVPQVKAGREAVKAGLPDNTEGRSSDTENKVRRHLQPDVAREEALLPPRYVQYMLTWRASAQALKQVVLIDKSLFSEVLRTDREHALSPVDQAMKNMRSMGMRPCISTENALQQAPERTVRCGNTELCVIALPPRFNKPRLHRELG